MGETRILLSGIAMGESPRWHDGRLWFADWLAGEIVAVDDAGRAEVMIRHRSLPLCFDFLPDGTPVVLSSSERALLAWVDGELRPYADLSGLGEHPWNDVVVDGRGQAYVNNIGFAYGEGEFAPGFVALVRPDGSVQRVAEGLGFPNGMAVTPDNRTLLVAESYGRQIRAYDIAADGSLGHDRVWAALDGYPDGICLDRDGGVWFADVPGQHCVRVREGGEVVDTLALDRGAFACMLGGPDGRTLYVTANAWSDETMVGAAERSGQIVAAPAPAARAGWPGQ